MRVDPLFVALLLTPASALAQVSPEGFNWPHTILVSANGKVETPPDSATLTMTVRGQGTTPDAATTALAAKQKAIFAGLRSLDPKLEIRTGSIGIREVRKGDCSGDSGSLGSVMTMADQLDSAADAMEATASGGSSSAKGPCIVVGANAETETTVILSAVKDAGTAVGLAGRLGARDARVESFGLRDDSVAAHRALAQAMAQARNQAEAIAAASGAKLGPLLSVTDGESNANRGVLAQRLLAYDIAPPALAMLAPIVLDIAPTPVETRAQLLVTFALLP